MIITIIIYKLEEINMTWMLEGDISTWARSINYFCCTPDIDGPDHDGDTDYEPVQVKN